MSAKLLPDGRLNLRSDSWSTLVSLMPTPQGSSDRTQASSSDRSASFPFVSTSNGSYGGSSSNSPPVSPPYLSSSTSSTPISSQVANDGSQTASLASPDSSIQTSGSIPSYEPIPLNYSVASHSVRITKYGYAIEPVELRYPEIINNLSGAARRSSGESFDGGQLSHKLLSLIRGFWSQPGFPRGKQIRNERLNSINAMLNEFGQYPLYPHEDTLGGMGKARARQPPKRIKKIIGSRPAAQERSSSRINESAIDEGLRRPLSPPLDTSDGTARTSRGGNDLLSLFISKQTRSPPLATAAKTPPPARSSSSFHSWIPKNKDQAFDLVTMLLLKMERIFSSETRIINISSPCLVLGDIHGNLIDLRTYERSLWPKAPNCMTSNYLFLGDYVDRGEYSIECVLYLFAMKSILPNRFYLLRGNHEVAAIQRQYTFGRECEIKFGSYGRDLWLAFNKVFDLMPVAAIIDNQIFCAHGGIPRSVSDIRLLANEIPSPLDNPELQCPAAWEILWNDPITDSELIGMIEMDNAVPTTAIQISQPSPSPPSSQSQAQSQSQVRPPAPAQSPLPPPQAQYQAEIQQQQQQQQRLARGTNNKRDSSKKDVDPSSSAAKQTPATSGSSLRIQPDADRGARQAGAADAAKSTARASSDQVDENRLSKVPSDTSSIASTSPQQIMNDGFIANIKRGTAYLFSDQAVNNFLRLNRLSHVIRAHEVIPTGFAFHGEGRVITIFSSSKYCGLNNQAACALVDRHKIRILRLDTGDAGE